jgi:hypothetical protein
MCAILCVLVGNLPLPWEREVRVERLVVNHYQTPWQAGERTQLLACDLAVDGTCCQVADCLDVPHWPELLHLGGRVIWRSPAIFYADGFIWTIRFGGGCEVWTPFDLEAADRQERGMEYRRVIFVRP